MASTVGAYFKKLREFAGISRGDLVRQLGFQNVNKGCRHLLSLEESGDADPDFVARVSAVLNPDPAELRRLTAEDRQRLEAEFEAWVNEPIEPHICYSPMPTIGVVRKFPPECKTQEQMEEFASEFSKTRRSTDPPRRRVILVLSRRHSVWFDAGEVTARIEATVDAPNGMFLPAFLLE